MTSGAAMMRFSRGFMRIAGALPVVPVALRADLGPWRIHTHTLTSGFLANLFWFSFPPRVRLEATVLPPMAPAEVGIFGMKGSGVGMLNDHALSLMLPVVLMASNSTYRLRRAWNCRLPHCPPRGLEHASCLVLVLM